jgi:hypothetical protein
MNILPSFGMEKKKLAAQTLLVEKHRRKMFLDQTVNSIEDVAGMRDTLAKEHPNKPNSSVLDGGMIDRSNVRLDRKKIYVGKPAIRGEKPLQVALLQCLAETVLNVNKVKQDTKGAGIAADMFRKLTEVEVAVNLKAPMGIARPEFTYEKWWDSAIQGLSPRQMEDMGKVLSQASAYVMGQCKPEYGKVFRNGVVAYWTQVVEGRKQLDVSRPPSKLGQLLKLLKFGASVGGILQPGVGAMVGPIEMTQEELKRQEKSERKDFSIS